MVDEQLENAKELLGVLNDNGYEAYMVGGYVRDRLLGIEAKDIDITTNALPEVVQSLFPDNFALNQKFRTITVRKNGYEFEITTYRKDKKYKDHRHPRTKVATSLRADIKRRDFTINAICMDKDLKIIDYCSGQEDLKNKLIKTVGIPYKRFHEDALRMFRAFRFAARLDFAIEPHTYKGIKKNASLVKTISKERIRDEITGMLDAKYLTNIIPIMVESEILKTFPDIQKALFLLNKNYHKIDFIELISFASFLKGETTEELLLSKAEKKQVEDINYLMGKMLNRAISPMDLLNYDYENIRYACHVLSILKEVPYSFEELKVQKENLPIASIKDLDINGDDIKKALHIEDSPVIKDTIIKLVKAVLTERVNNDKKELVKFLKDEKI